MVVRIGIIKPETAFLPEAHAYHRLLTMLNNVQVKIYDNIASADNESDIIIVFLGFVPFWRKCQSFIIAEYHSLSTGRWSLLKNIIKRMINIRGGLYVFLNEEVRKGLCFSKRKPFVYRSMGFDEALCAQNRGADKKFDMVYAGSLNREGVVDAINRLAQMGFSIAVVGNCIIDKVQTCQLAPSVTSFGKVDLANSYRIMASARMGINYTPDIYPYNIQDSTKVIEYAALGLGVITNDYVWVNSFESKINGRFLRLNAIETREDVENFDFKSGDIAAYAWSNVLEHSGLLSVVNQIVLDVMNR